MILRRFCKRRYFHCPFSIPTECNRAETAHPVLPGRALCLPAVPSRSPQLADTKLNQLRALDFVIQELGLYLDTHPNDSEAFALFQNYVELEKAARESYVEQHGPLTQNDAALNSTYTWGNGPWPWQYSEEEA